MIGGTLLFPRYVFVPLYPPCISGIPALATYLQQSQYDWRHLTVLMYLFNSVLYMYFFIYNFLTVNFFCFFLYIIISLLLTFATLHFFFFFLYYRSFVLFYFGSFVPLYLCIFVSLHLCTFVPLYLYCRKNF